MVFKIYISILVLLLTTFNIKTDTYTHDKDIEIMETRINYSALNNLTKNKTTKAAMINEYIPTITIDRTETIIDEYRYNITEKEFNEFVRVVEAEVTGSNTFGVGHEETFNSKLRVAQVILNRVESPYFPDTVHDVIFQKNAFTPLVDGRYWEVEINQVTIDACKAALLKSTQDLTNGCEFFSSGTKTCKYGSYIFTDSVGHSFFKTYRTD